MYLHAQKASYVSGELLNTLADKSAVARFVIGDADAPDMELIVRGDRLGGYDESDEIKLFPCRHNYSRRCV